MVRTVFVAIRAPFPSILALYYYSRVPDASPAYARRDPSVRAAGPLETQFLCLRLWLKSETRAKGLGLKGSTRRWAAGSAADLIASRIPPGQSIDWVPGFLSSSVTGFLGYWVLRVTPFCYLLVFLPSCLLLFFSFSLVLFFSSPLVLFFSSSLLLFFYSLLIIF